MIHIGQAGVQLGNAFWELFCLEHNIDVNGKICNPEAKENEGYYKTLFKETKSGQYVPRALYADLEPVVIGKQNKQNICKCKNSTSLFPDEIRNGPYRCLFHPQQLQSGDDDGANNFARAYFNTGNALMQEGRITDTLRRLVEDCERLSSFFYVHSMSGGTGSGLQARIMETSFAEFPRKTNVQISMFPSRTLSTSVVEPYNTALSIWKCMHISDMNLIFDNMSIYRQCSDRLGIDRPTYHQLNRVVAHVISAVLGPTRYCSDFNELQTNLVPFNMIHFPTMSFAPLTSEAIVHHSKNSINSITLEAFEKTSQFLDINPKEGKYMACAMIYRGDVPTTEVYDTLHNLKSMMLVIL